MAHIRFAGEDDIDGMAALLHHLFTQEHEFEPSAEAQRDGLRAILASPSIGRLLVAEEAGSLQGMANLLYTQSTALGGRVAILDDMILLPEARGRGLGRRLIDAAIEACRADGCRRITLHTDPDNHLARRSTSAPASRARTWWSTSLLSHGNARARFVAILAFLRQLTQSRVAFVQIERHPCSIPAPSQGASWRQAR